MEFNDKSRQALKAFSADPANPKNVYAIGALYWSALIEKLGALIREKMDYKAFMQQESDFINFGLLPEMREDYETVRNAITGDYSSYRHLRIRLFSDWLIEKIEDIIEGNQKDLLDKDIAQTRMQIKHINGEIESTQQARKELLLGQFGGPAGSLPSGAALAQIGRLTQLDALTLESMRTKKAIAKGAFFSVDQRRVFVGLESQIQKEQARYEAFLSQVKDKNERAALNNFTTQITGLYSKVIDLEDAIAKMEKKIAEIQEKQQTMSPAEIENRITLAVEYIRDLAKLCAKRLRIESCSILRPGDPFFTVQEIFACLDRVHEFDPRAFCNDRVSFLGRPSILLVPGNGNALYDWKNNEFIVPFVPPAGDFVGSIATAMIEYRFDVDDEKKLLNSYLKLPECRDARSTFMLKGKLAKDYLAWMTSEYKGYRVLSKDIKKWFEHEIAPNRKEIFCPPQYQEFTMSSKQFRAILDEVEARLHQDISESAEEDLWTASILNYQQGNFERAFECIKCVLKKNEQHLFAYYNLGHIGMKISRKQDALYGFGEFLKRNPQSWWASVARDHVRHLQMS